MCRIYDLFGLIWILLASHQSLSCTNLSEQAFSKADKHNCCSIRQVSLANRWGVLFKAFNKLFILDKGPGIEPCGTPILMGLVDEEILF